LRVLQLIDSLQVGGAERVSVNIANTLSPKIDASFLCATRKEGLLKGTINDSVGYLFLNKQKTIDFKSIRILNRFVKTNKIDLIHAHSTSFFLATIIKLFNKKMKIVWHDHYGDSEFLEYRNSKILKKCSNYFSQIFSVNKELATWARINLKCKKVNYLPNFAIENKIASITNLNGEQGKRIIHLANFREQKDHLTLLNALKKIIDIYPNWTLHCVGKDFKDQYMEDFKNKIIQLELEANVFIYDSKPDVFNILNQSDIGVLSSKSEGLPIALLEYGLANLPVITTNVGDCPQVVANKNLGQLIAPNKVSELYQALIYYISDMETAREKGKQLNKYVNTHFSANAISSIIINYYKAVI